MKHVIFDWGDTLMRDDPSRADAMCLWPQVEMVAGADIVLKVLSEQYHISLATSAPESNDQLIRRALKRVGLDDYVRTIFTAKIVGAKKTEPAFWHHVLRVLETDPASVVMVGDGFEGDVFTPASIGIQSFWLNERSSENRRGLGYRTIFRLSELLSTEPNQAILPTPMLVTPAACAPIAPTNRMAHL